MHPRGLFGWSVLRRPLNSITISMPLSEILRYVKEAPGFMEAEPLKVVWVMVSPSML